MTTPRVFTSFDDLRLDFNQLTELLSSNNLKSRISSNSLDYFVLQSCFQIKEVHNNNYFKSLIQKIIKNYNFFKSKVNVDLFVGFTQGSISIIHHDEYDVFLFSLYGETIYIINKEKYLLKPGDLIKINKGELHQAISLTPRIIFSLAITKSE